ncbi:MAG: GDP-mannose 4,6-dehydratase [Rhabdochlamydiaceae bacterium]|nr:GDP-mannose 4,6-dehydratase [Candidatus Amphrikana amoebophyrae]
MLKILFSLLFITSINLNAKTILVTGGCGFIGSNLCHNLIKEGDEVICVDSLVCSSIQNIAPLINNPNFYFIQADICDELTLDFEIDEIYNLACPASPVTYQVDPIQTLRTSFVGVENLLKLAKKHNAKFLQSSTSEIYGDPLVHPQTEIYWGNVNPIGPRACYDEGKRVAETLIFAYHKQYDLDVKVVRIFNTYGPNMNPKDGRVVPNFITQALSGNRLTIYGDGSQTRSFCYVDDLIQGLKLMMASKKGYTGPVNLGNPKEITISEFAHAVCSLTSSPGYIKKPLPQDDPTRRKPDMSLFRK